MGRCLLFSLLSSLALKVLPSNIFLGAGTCAGYFLPLRWYTSVGRIRTDPGKPGTSAGPGGLFEGTGCQVGFWNIGRREHTFIITPQSPVWGCRPGTVVVVGQSAQFIEREGVMSPGRERRRRQGPGKAAQSWHPTES